VRARALGYAPRALGILSGETGSVARAQVRQAARARPGTCLVSGGELTVRVRGRGRGGRNQEFVLSALCELARLKPPERGRRFLIFAAGTDGRDGNTPAAGAWADERTLARARALKLDPKRFLARNDSYGFFRKVGGLVVTGPTGTNVMDFRAVLVLRAPASRPERRRTRAEA
jgi:glycerate-2-kinase